MLSKKQKIGMFVLGLLGVIFGIVVAVPFRVVPKLNQIDNIFTIETIIKLCLGIVALLLAIIPLVKKYRLLNNYRENSKVVLVMSYFPIVCYVMAIILSSLQIVSFDYLTAGTVFVLSERILSIVIAALIGYLLFAVYVLLRAYKVMMKVTPKENILLDVVSLLFLVCFMIFGWRISSTYAFEYGDSSFYKTANPFVFFVLVFILIGSIGLLVYLVKILKKDEQLIHFVGGNGFDNTIRQKEQAKAYNAILDDYEYYFSQHLSEYEQLDIEEADASTEEAEESFDEASLNTEEIVLEEENEPTLEQLNNDDSDEVKAIQKEVEETIKQVEEKNKQLKELEDKQKELQDKFQELKAKRAQYDEDFATFQDAKIQSIEANVPVVETVKQPKKIVPSFDKLLEFANTFSEHEGFKVQSNPKGNLVKFYIGKKMFLVMQATTNDYRVNFITTSEKFVSYLQSRPGELTAPKNLKDNYWVRVVNKGKEDPKFLRKVIKEAVQTALTQIEEEKAAKIAERKAKAAAKRAQSKAAK